MDQSVIRNRDTEAQSFDFNLLVSAKTFTAAMLASRSMMSLSP